jgi:hypothetical protein
MWLLLLRPCIMVIRCSAHGAEARSLLVISQKGRPTNPLQYAPWPHLNEAGIAWNDYYYVPYIQMIHHRRPPALCS